MATIIYPTKATLPVDTNRDYPVNQKVSWHGGIHLVGMAYDVQAIMNGTVVYARQKSGKHNQVPLNYLGATHDGCVLLKHTLTLPKGSVSVTFYSLYMHLMDVEPSVISKVGKSIKQGTKLGKIGMANGKWAMHFQICCDLANFTNLVGRQQTKLDISKNGRTDCSYGCDHYYLPKGTELSVLKQNKLVPMYKTDEPYYVITDYQATQIITEKSGNYELTASTERYIYNHHLRVKHLGQYAFVNLNSSSIKKYTDADFPHWQGWSVINDDRDQNSQCNSSTVLGWLDSKILTATQKNKLKKMAICNFPFEWTAATISTRFGWLKTSPPKGSKAFTDSDMKKFEEHIKALCFYDKLPEADQKALRLRIWHFDPRAFIEHLNKAGIVKLPALIYKTKRQMNDYKAADMLYGDLTKDEILKIFGKDYYDFVDVAAFDATKAPQLFNTFRDQSKIFAWGEYAPLMIRMINQLQKNIGGIYTDSLMDKAMSDHSTMANSVKQIGEFIGSRLKSNNGRLYEDDLKIIEDNIRNTKLPRFDTWRDNTNGLGITIHDTWSTHITLESISITGRQYTAKISYKIQDHFGLDNTDIKDGGALGIKFKTLRMFRIWFILQRWKGHGFKPFINEMNVVKIVTGTF